MTGDAEEVGGPCWRRAMGPGVAVEAVEREEPAMQRSGNRPGSIPKLAYAAVAAVGRDDGMWKPLLE